MSDHYVPCFYRIDFVIIPSHIELPWLIKFQNDHIFQHNGFIQADKKYLDIFF